MTLAPDVIAGQIIFNMIQNAFIDTLKFKMMPPGWATKTCWEQVRFPRSKKKRIRKKWAKDKRNYGMVVHVVRLYHVESPRMSYKITGIGGEV